MHPWTNNPNGANFYRCEVQKSAHDVFGLGNSHAISTVGTQNPEVQMYDSVYSCCPTSCKAQFASLLATQHTAIEIKHMDVQMQSGGYDCGLFAIAYATALVLGKQPGNFLFDQEKIRPHLLNCFEDGHITMFPTGSGELEWGWRQLITFQCTAAVCTSRRKLLRYQVQVVLPIMCVTLRPHWNSPLSRSRYRDCFCTCFTMHLNLSIGCYKDRCTQRLHCQAWL